MAKRNDREATSLLLTIDRIEEGTAVLISDGGLRIHLPAEILPEGAVEGTVLDLILEVDREETLSRAAEVGDLQRRLLERDE